MSDINQELRKQKRDWIHKLEIHRDSAIDFVAVWGPLAAPLVPAGLTAAAIIVTFPTLLHIGLWGAIAIAVVTVIVLEVLGLVSVETWLNMKTFNAEHLDAKEQAPEGQARAIVIIYALVVLALVFILKIWQGAALYSLIPLTLLGLITSWTVVLRKQHNDRVWRAEQGNQSNAALEALQTELDNLRTALDQSRKESVKFQQSADVWRKESEALHTELDQSRKEFDQLRTQLDLSGILSELTETQQANLLEIIRLVGEHRITGPADILKVSELGKSTVYGAWPIAVASRAIYKNGDGAFHVAH